MIKGNFDVLCKWLSCTPKEKHELWIYLHFIRFRKAIEVNRCD